MTTKQLLTEINSKALSGKFLCIHGDLLSLWDKCENKKLLARLLPKIKSIKGRYHFIALMAQYTEDNYDSTAYKAVKRANELYKAK